MVRGCFLLLLTAVTLQNASALLTDTFFTLYLIRVDPFHNCFTISDYDVGILERKV